MKTLHINLKAKYDELYKEFGSLDELPDKKDESRNFSIDSLEMSSEESKGLQSSGIVM